jgi:hypothetical protein
VRPHQGRGMPSKSRSSQRSKSRAKPAASVRHPSPPKASSAPAKKTPPKSSHSPPSKPPAKAPAKSSAPAAVAPPLEVPLPGGRRHVLSLSFVRDGDEFMARLETDTGHITELKNRALDQLLTLVAGELEDLLE